MAQGGPIRVLVVEDQELARQLLELQVNASGRYHVERAIKNADLAYLYCAQGGVDLVLMDVVTELGANGIEAAARIKAELPQVKVIVVTSMPEASYLKRAHEAGVDSFWYKELQEEPLLNVMDRTMAGEGVYPAQTPEVFLGRASSRNFTDRELDVLRALTGGLTNEQIGDELFISAETVKGYVASLLAKTGFKTRTELAVKARECGLVIRDGK